VLAARSREEEGEGEGGKCVREKNGRSRLIYSTNHNNKAGELLVHEEEE
jgi:hypothetical protein